MVVPFNVDLSHTDSCIIQGGSITHRWLYHSRSIHHIEMFTIQGQPIIHRWLYTRLTYHTEQTTVSYMADPYTAWQMADLLYMNELAACTSVWLPCLLYKGLLR